MAAMTNKIRGDVRAVECEGCEIDAGSIQLSALGVKDLVVKVRGGVVTVAKKSWLKRHGKKCFRLEEMEIK